LVDAERSPRRAVRLIGLFVAFVGSGCGGAPTAPSATSLVASLEVDCPASEFVGETVACVATARFSGGQTEVVNSGATWSSSDPAIATLNVLGGVTGQSAGQALISASYGGQTGSAQVLVQALDALIATSSFNQGDQTVGSTETLGLQGYYGVASADSGQLSLAITDQNGTLITTSAPMTVPRGGSSFVLSDTFTIPPSTTQVCRTAVLQIGPNTLTATGSSDIFPCLPVRQ